MKQTGHRSSLILLELIINLFLFAICAAVCVGLLLHARGMSAESRNLTQAVYIAQTIAEEWQATGAMPMWCTPDEEGFTADINGDVDTLSITISKNEKQIYALEGVRRHE